MAKRVSLLRRLLAPAIRRGRVFGRDERGVTAIEFGILALPFFTIIAAILETSIMFFAGQILDSAVQDSGRLIRTGQAQTQSYAPADFRAAMCSRLMGIFDCAQLRVSVTVVTSFADATVADPVETGEDCDPICEWTLAEAYSPGAGGEVVLVQAFYKWSPIVNLPGFNLQNQPDGSRLLGAVRVFRNEPFACEDCT